MKLKERIAWVLAHKGRPGRVVLHALLWAWGIENFSRAIAGIAREL